MDVKMSWYEIVQKQCIDIVSNVSPLKRREPSYTVVVDANWYSHYGVP